MALTSAPRFADTLIAVGGESGRLTAGRDWAKTPLGPLECWSQSLRTALTTLLASPIPIVMLWGEDGVMLYNDAYSLFAGGRHPQLLGSNVREGWPEVADFNDNVMRVGLAGGTLAYRDQELTLFRHGRPEQVWMNLDYSPVLDEQGKAAGVLAIVVETTERVTADRRQTFRLALEERLWGFTNPVAIIGAATQALGEHLDVAQVGFGEIDEAQAHATVNADWNNGRIASVVGTWRMDDFGPVFIRDMKAGCTIAIADVRFDPRTNSPAVLAAYERIATRAMLDVPLVRDGHMRAMLFIHHPEPRAWSSAEVSLVEETCARLWSAVERVRAERELRVTAERNVEILESISDAFYTIGPDSRFTYVNRKAEELWGKTAKELLGEVLWERFPQAVGSKSHHAHERAMRDRKPVRIETTSPVLRRWIGVDIHPTAGGGLSVYFRDITDRKRAEAALHELNDSLERRVAETAADLDRVWRNASDMFVVIDSDGMFRRVNPAATTMLGWTEHELIGRTVFDLIHPDDIVPTRRALEYARAEILPTFENRYRTRDGGLRTISWVAAPEGTLIYAYGRDITIEKERQAELEAAQEALRQSQKMEAMGQLTGGVAHDFNNLLTPIFGSFDMLQRRGVGGEREQRLIAGAMQSAERAKVLVQRLLAFARRQPLQSVAVDIAHLVTGMGDLVSSTTGPQIRVAVEAPEGLPPAKADPNQLEMALLNLAVNARDAMPEGGTLRITASVEQIGPQHRSKLRPAAYIRLSVADTGTGMDAATLQRAVEPFFSTKGVGKGTGLGLSMVHGLASQLGGALTIQSRLGVGTNIELWLPQSDLLPDAHGAAAPEPARTAAHGTALLVDDEELARMSTADMLNDLGYSVVEAASGEEAMRLFSKGERFDLLITDHLMPGMNGTDLARTIRAEQPGLPVFLVSGYAEHEGLEADLPRLTKPFRKDELAASLAQFVEFH